MKRSQEILGLPVLSMTETVTNGKVRTLLVNPSTRKIDFILVEPEEWYLEHMVIPFADVSAIGEDALLINNIQKAVKVSTRPNALTLLSKEIWIVGAKVMTTKGRLVGRITEIAVDEETGELAGCEWQALGQDTPTGYILQKNITTFGKEMLVVVDNFQETLCTFEELSAKAGIIVMTTAISPVQVNNISVEQNQDVELLGKDIEPLSFFEDKQKQYLLGREVAQEIITDTGEVIAQKGAIITQEIIEKAITADRFVELTLNTNA